MEDRAADVAARILTRRRQRRAYIYWLWRTLTVLALLAALTWLWTMHTRIGQLEKAKPPKFPVIDKEH